MSSNGSHPPTKPVNGRRKTFPKGAELLRERRLQSELELERGNCRTHLFPVLSESKPKKTGNLPGPQNNNQARLRLAWVNPDFPDAPRKYAQSKSGQVFSHGTSPPDSRSMRTANDSLQAREPYAIFRRWPDVVSQRSEKSSRSETDMDSQYGLKSMTEYHHTVIKKQSLLGEFTEWLSSDDNILVKLQELQDIRRENLRAFLLREGWNFTDIAKRYAEKQGKLHPRPGFFSELLSTKPPKAGKKRKSFAEKLALGIEDAVGLKSGQLSIKNSPLEMEEEKPRKARDELKRALSDISDPEANELVAALREMRRKTAQKGERRRIG